MKKLFLILTLIAGMYLLSAQNSVFNTNAFNDSNLLGSLLNPYKLKMSQSMGFAAGTSSNGLGFYESRFTNHFSYEFSPKLNMELDLSLVNFGSASTGKGINFDTNDDNKTKIIPEFSLKYKPSKTVTIQLEYKNLNNYYPWLNRTSDW